MLDCTDLLLPPLTACTASNRLQLAASWPDSEIRPTGRVKKMTPDHGAGLVPMSRTLSEGSVAS